LGLGQQILDAAVAWNGDVELLVGVAVAALGEVFAPDSMS